MTEKSIDLDKFNEYIFPANVVNDGDKLRWKGECFSLCQENGKAFMLEQKQGGPCGVIAAVQAFMLVHICFKGSNQLESVSSDGAADALCEALCDIIVQATPEGEQSTICISSQHDSTKVIGLGFNDRKKIVEGLAENLGCYTKPGGIMLFLFSLLESRGLETVRNDMDDGTQGLTGQFGHCTQELMNLLLCGVASSQVHDKKIDIGGGMFLRGVPKRPVVGYLTHLEALRYCQVGSFYKKPELPIWILGSESHYTVMFGLDKTINEESRRQRELARAKRAFNELDQQENGFVRVEQVPVLLRTLDVDLNETAIAQFVEKCEMPGSGLVLWNDFWTAVKPILVPALEWNCPACTYLNARESSSCEICTTTRKDDVLMDGGEEDEENQPQTLDLYHINGIVSTQNGQRKGPALVEFKLTIVSKDLQAPSTHGHGVPIEEVLHTRWSGSVFLWPDDKPPSIIG